MNKITLALLLTSPLLILTWLPLAPPPNGAPAASLLISEYVEGSYNNKALELYNGTAETITLTGHYTLFVSFNGGVLETSLPLTGTVAPRDVFVIAHPQASGLITTVADQIDTGQQTVIWNGNDAIVLYHNGSVVDSMGQIGDTSYWGRDITLARLPTVITGDTVTTDTFTLAGWDRYPKDTFDGLGSPPRFRHLHLPLLLHNYSPKPPPGLLTFAKLTFCEMTRASQTIPDNQEARLISHFWRLFWAYARPDAHQLRKRQHLIISGLDFAKK